MILVTGNLLALIGSLLMLMTGLLKSKRKILLLELIQTFLFIACDFLLKGYTGAIIEAISLILIILCYKNKLNLAWKIIISLLAIFVTIFINNLGLIGLLPIFALLIKIWFMNVPTANYKLLLAVTLFIWLIYDLSIKIYTSSIFDFISVIFNLITYFQIKLKLNNKNTVKS